MSKRIAVRSLYALLAVFAVASCQRAVSSQEATVSLSLGDVLGPTKPNMLGQNVIFHQGGGNGHLIDARTNEVYPDIVKALQEERPTVMRYPGGLFGNFFHWQETIGPVAQRKPQSVDGELPNQPPLLGVDEFLKLISSVDGCEALMIVNVSKSSQWRDGTAKEAAAWVAYCNAMPENQTPLGVDETGRDWKTAGYWATQRARNGHPAPYRVKYWELGNELNQDAPKVYKSAEYLLTAEEYATRAGAFIAAMKAVDPSIKVGVHGYCLSCKPENDPVSPKGGGLWMPAVIGVLGGKFDFFVWHHYNTFTLSAVPRRDRDEFCRAVMGWSLEYHEPTLKKIKSWLRAGAPAAEVWLTEYYRFSGIVPDESRGRNLVVALGTADFIMQNLTSRDLDAAQHFGFNTGGTGTIFPGNGKMYFGKQMPEGRILRFPIHWVFGMFGVSVFREIGGTILDARTQCASYPVMGHTVPELRVVAAVNKAGDHLDVLLLNKSLDHPVHVTIRIAARDKQVKAVEATEFNSGKPQSDYPLFDNNDDGGAPVVCARSTQAPAIRADGIAGTLPPHSLTMYRCELGSAAAR